jgi:glycerophosphoryl diester phosphodiesterase
MFFKIIPFVCLLLSNCTQINSNTMLNSSDEENNPKTGFDLQGHRGCRGLLPENTIPAMLKALELGVTTLEMDAVITKDSMVILSHEPFFNHEIATKPDGTPVTEVEERSLNIYQMDIAEVQRYDVGMRPHPRFTEQQKIKAVKPLLSEVFTEVKAWCKASNKPLPFFNIETKSLPSTDNKYHPVPSVFVDLLMQVIQDADLTEKVIIQSFDFRTLKYAHETYPGVRLAALVEPFDVSGLNSQLSELEFIPEIYSPAFELVNANLVKACKEKGMLLIPWTVNDTATAVKLKALGVDGLITDYPDRVK